MTYSTDLEFARKLQEQLDKESAEDFTSTEQHSLTSQDSHFVGAVDKPLSIVDERWELIDPSPDIRVLFLEFNDQYFWGKLAGVEVKWSPRMTLCAGLCCYEGRGGLCSIRLSSPLLKLRPRKDLVETLLHEMIHALLFVTQNNKDHDAHGPEFHKHMYRINKATGTNISVYHNFHDEVDSYRQHWWRCNGPCQKRKPYFGIVRRAMNRAPSPRDPWWGEHQRTCGGTYTKIKEPEGYGQKSKGKKVENKESDGFGKKHKGTKEEVSQEPRSQNTGSKDIRNLFSHKNPSLSDKTTKSLHSENLKDVHLQPQYDGDDAIPSTSSLYSGTGHVLGGTASGVSRLLDRTFQYNKENHSSSQKGKALKAKRHIPSPITCFSDSSSDEEHHPVKRKVSKTDNLFNREIKKPRVDTDMSNTDRNLTKSLTDSQIVSKHRNQSGTVSILDAFERQKRLSGNKHHKMPVNTRHDDNDEDVVFTSISVKQPVSKTSTENATSRSCDEGNVMCPVCATPVISSRINQHLDLCLGQAN